MDQNNFFALFPRGGAVRVHGGNTENSWQVFSGNKQKSPAIAGLFCFKARGMLNKYSYFDWCRCKLNVEFVFLVFYQRKGKSCCCVVYSLYTHFCCC